MSNVQGMQTKQADYQYALEGVGFAQQVIKNQQQKMDETITNLNNPEVMGGETGKEYAKRMQQANEVVNAVLQRYYAFANKVAEVCRTNGAQVDGSMMDDFDAVEKAFASKAEDISKFKGQARG